MRVALGISPHAWGQAYLTFGREEAITALAAICARHAAGKVASPGGLLRCMVELHGKGSLRLDRTLFGLADKLRKDTIASNDRIKHDQRSRPIDPVQPAQTPLAIVQQLAKHFRK